MAKENLHITLFQFDLVWENPAANRALIDEMLCKTSDPTDVVFLPEMFATGFTMNVHEMAETMEGETVEWMKTRSRERGTAICGSLVIAENQQYFNRLLFVEPSGKISFYDKRHLFTMGNENQYFQAGKERLIVDYMGWRICPLICYDLRFPVWSRNRNEYDLLVFSANWPGVRNDVWNTLLKARAIENQCYVVGVNRVGKDGLGIEYLGESQVFGPKGNLMDKTGSNTPEILSTSLSLKELNDFRMKFPVLNDADDFNLINHKSNL
jgi:predicted amidohydrolase